MIRLTGWVTIAMLGALACVPRDAPPGPDRFGAASDPLEAAVDAYLAPYVARGDFNGVVLIGRGDDVLLHKSYGFADLERRVPHGPDTRFRTASLTKTFTSAAILVLRDRGALSLDDRLSRFGSGHEDAERISIEHLLAHASGLAEPDPAFTTGDDAPLDELVAHITARPLTFEPGSRHRYSNAGYNVLAWVVERATGMPFDAFLDETFFSPLGMDDTGHFTDDDSPPAFALGHAPAPGPAGVARTTPVSTSSSIGSGSLHSSSGDLYRWGLAVARESAFRLEGLAWPYGWGRIEAGEHRGIEQTGATEGFVSSLSVFPESETVVVCLNNVEAGAWIGWSEDLARLALGISVEPPRLPEEVPVDAAELDRFVGTYRGDEGHRFRVVNDGGLYLFWNDYPHGKYLTPVGEAAFVPRSDSGTVRFEVDGEGRVVRLIRGFDADTRSYARDP